MSSFEIVDNRHTGSARAYRLCHPISHTGAWIFRHDTVGIAFCPEHAKLFAGTAFDRTQMRTRLAVHCGRRA